MAHRSLWLFALALLVGIALLLGRSCTRDDTAGNSAAVAPAASDAAADASGPESGAAAAEGQRQQAISTAVDTLHRYLFAISTGDHAKANAFWADGKPAAAPAEADLRTLQGASARIQNDPPKPLDSEAVPAALEIPIELRISVEGAPVRHYSGWYRLRAANPVQGPWKITSASVRVRTP
ncbi:hypothetical protein M2650_11255 [Luteimonas sp. SX5]|uniref:Nuclear transport factor 2 family protein n=1 Tax=Luteimonas galliterrae TaxID=2940486 RepID=A0ABT0MK02_9GAMM|nr:hypothetical protein [Luteimonas galliterrae]MCL1635201.1 hypothetical protein [Luteimonas galliterrae]